MAGFQEGVGIFGWPADGKWPIVRRSVRPCSRCGSVHPEGAPSCRQAPEGGPPSSAPGRSIAAEASGRLVGRVLGDKYGVLRILGHGGMGAVYEAEHLAIGRLVAVKVLHPAHARRPEAVSRLEHEARVVGAIGHPNICEIYDLGRLEDGAPYLVMERLRGETLAERIARAGRLYYADALDVALQVLSALHAAHDKGVIHRDLKPENVFLVERMGMRPLAKLLDFGVSKIQEPEQSTLRMTRTGMVVGTPYYMAPEQALGERPLDHRVDLWGVGVLLYEALSAARPFEGRNYNALLARIVTTVPRPLGELAPEVPPGLVAIVERGLAKSRDDRFPSARSFQEALLAFKREAAVSSLPEVSAEFSVDLAGLETLSDPMEDAPAASPLPMPIDEGATIDLTDEIEEEAPAGPVWDDEATIVDPPDLWEESATSLLPLGEGDEPGPGSRRRPSGRGR